ncbi:N-acetylmuramoyl-L-alanine amidase [Wenxinia marina]|uniref:N-acetylmuramoyl-L-alanine amidase n=1 Tax=Wenxinia marina DSM 24838 TaxID=1123501 RepID=A0A0D0QG29_9RHOB|nr:N-acetylmuramoyl-L-alanine amidase [Wenxinia marina]KIQ69998.1 N-acetylmuramoyl-L-alanine amidase [Wenxinia marina DSM 24838]GGL62753.1 N-acetylmuramoyl-L-alanine amidase [Wenxinia marina]
MRIWRHAKGAGLVLLLALCAGAAAAQDFSALARFDPARSQVRDAGEGLSVEIGLSIPVPWRAYTLDDPPRLVLDFREVDWQGARREALMNADNATGLRFGPVATGWSRLVVDLAGPLAIDEAGMRVGPSGRADVTVRLAPASPEAFAAASGVPDGAEWAVEAETPPPPPPKEGPLVVVIDPGHGGIDPGAAREGAVEAELMLALALELAEAVNRTEGMTAILTRDADVFVPLARRMSLARAANADVLISLHADALEEGAARGASIYTLSDEAEDSASERMAERHDRGDLLAGLDLSGQDDTVATVLMDLARLETRPASERLAIALVSGLETVGAPLNSRPRRVAPLAVLAAADFPSVLVETGFLSSESDRERLSTPEGRAPLVEALLLGLQRFAAGEEARAPLVRQ